MARNHKSLKRGWKKYQRRRHLANLNNTLHDVAVLTGRLQAALSPERWAEVEAELAGEGESYKDPWQRESFLLELAAEVGV
jgi:hypothetical protein